MCGPIIVNIVIAIGIVIAYNIVNIVIAIGIAKLHQGIL